MTAESSGESWHTLDPKTGRTARYRVVSGYLALAAPSLAILADTAIALARGWHFETRADFAGPVAALGWLAMVSLAVSSSPGRRFLGQNATQLITLLVSGCVAWSIAELALGPVMAKVGDPFHGRRPGLKMINHPVPGIMRDVGSEAIVSYNSWGIRGQDPPARSAAYRILCLGGSTTACTYLDDHKTWPHLLEVDLQSAAGSTHYWVGNTGLPGLRSAAHLRFLQESPVVDQIDCLVVQAGINDFMSALIGPNPAPPVWSHSRIWQLARAFWRQWASPGTMVEDAAATVYVDRRAARRAAEVQTSAPALDPGLNEFADNVQQIINVCRQHHLRLVFTTQPVLWRDDLDERERALLWFGLLADGRYLSVEQLRAGMDRYNATLLQLCSENGVDLIDLSVLNGNPAIFYDDCHFTETGAREVARLVADWFLAHAAVVADGGAK